MHPTHSQPAPLTPVQQEVVSALTAGVPVTAAAKAAGLHRSTIYVWQKTNPTFAAALAQAQQDRLTRLRDLTRETNLNTILAVLSNPAAVDTFDTPPPARAEPKPPPPASTPRNAPCPCGSRLKYKRCCGRNAPPALSTPF